MTQYARLTTKRCPMHDPSCAAKVTEAIIRFFSAEFNAVALIEERCGRFTRGAHKGQLRGWAEIDIVTEGGWRRNGPGEGNGRVLYPGTVYAVRILPFQGPAYLEVSL